MKYFSFWGFALLVALVACQSKPNAPDGAVVLSVVAIDTLENIESVVQEPIVIDLLNCTVVDTLFVEDVFNVEIVFLDGGNSTFVSSVEKVYWGEPTLIFDTGLGGRVLTCHSDGTNLREIPFKGHGVGEIPFISSVFVGDKLYLCGGPQLNVYNLEDFSFEKKYETLNVQCNDFLVIDHEMISMYNSNFRDMFAELNTYSFKDGSGRKLMPFVKHTTDSSKSGYCTGHLTCSSLGQALFSRKFENIIYRVDPDTLTELYKIKAYRENLFVVPVDERTTDRYSRFSVHEFFDLDNCLLLNVSYLDGNEWPHPGVALYDKKTKKTTFYKKVWSRQIESNISLLQGEKNQLTGCFPVTFVHSLREDAVGILSNKYATDKKKKAAQFILEHTTESVNPILFRMKLK